MCACGPVGQVASRRAGGVVSRAAHILTRGVARPAHRRGARQRKARVARVADLVHRCDPSVVVQMTFTAPEGVYASVNILRVRRGLRRGHPDPGDHGQSQEDADRRASTSKAMRSPTVHGVLQFAFTPTTACIGVSCRNHACKRSHAMDRRRRAGSTRGRGGHCPPRPRSITRSPLTGRRLVRLYRAGQWTTLTVTVALLRRVLLSLARCQTTL